MSYCINPHCSHRENPDGATHCQSCGTSLLVDDRYQILRPLRPPNPAAMTDVYEVKDWGTNQLNWGEIKVLKIFKFTHNPKLVRLFRREARVLMWLRHPGIPKVEPDGYFTVTLPRNKIVHGLVMEKIEGENLEQWLSENGAISTDRALDWLQQLTELLHVIHQHNLGHRDLKPSNLILRPNGELALVDFGTVAEFGADSQTRVGTSGYAAPEQLEGKATRQSDFFALGRTFVHLLSGLSPMEFPETDKGELQWRDRVADLERPLADAIDELMAPDWKARAQHTKIILQRLEQIRAQLKSSQERPGSGRSLLWKAALPWVGIAGVVGVGWRVLSPAVQLYWNHAIAPNISQQFNELTVTNFQDKNFEKALLFGQLALNFDRDNSYASYNLAMVYEEKEDYRRATEYYERAIADGEPRTQLRATNNLARLQIWRAGDTQGAIARLSDALERARHYEKIDPQTLSDLYKNLGWAYFQENRNREAERQLREAIALDDRNIAAYCLLAQTLERTPDDDRGGNAPPPLLPWKQCARDSDLVINPETRVWQMMARQRLDEPHAASRSLPTPSTSP
ncbi:serine/threonine-protein kinase [Oxynema aestuarii]|uniref:non-specific serine/threonine protein kinase n=1 Tax=Oxynema aestuarii AP17 TaxID=2064643 RepID=A0A6H1U125_9CYAN|nr:serine/threonine-protein kinase [Oxynema aestuarii]QIZ72146.1 protein kinase [Oxynema aestuarii AP17]